MNLVRAYDGESIAVDQERVVGTTNGMQKTMSQQKGMGSWRVNVLEGKDQHILPPGESHPMLALGLGELDDEQIRALEMAPAAKFLESVDMPSDGRLRESDDLVRVVESRGMTAALDDAEVTGFMDRERPSAIRTVRTTKGPDLTPNGNGGTLMLVVGAAVCLYFFM